MVYNNFGCIESVALLYTLLSIFVSGGYIGYGLIKYYYACKINQEYTKKEISKYSPYYVAHIKLNNLQKYVVDKDIDEYTKLIEQITTNLLFKFNGVYAMSSYNNIYILLPRKENMTFSVDKEDIFNHISNCITNNIKEIENLSVGVHINYIDIYKNHIGNYFNHVIHQNKFKFMKYLAKNSDVKITYNRNINPNNSKYMNKYFVKYREQTNIDYIKNPVYATHYKCVSDNQAIVFKSELSSIVNNKNSNIKTDIDIDIDNDDFFIEDMIEESCIIDNTNNYEVHYLDNQDYNAYDDDEDEEETEDKDDEDEESDDSEEKEKTNDDSLDYYKCRVFRDDEVSFSSNIRASSVNDALMRTYEVMCNLNIPNPETLKYEIFGNTYMVHQSDFGHNACHQFILIEQTSNGNSAIDQEEKPDTNSDTSDDMPPLIADSPHEQQEQCDLEEEVHVGEEDLNDVD